MDVSCGLTGVLQAVSSSKQRLQELQEEQLEWKKAERDLKVGGQRRGSP
jgi:hypothetical protein